MYSNFALFSYLTFVISVNRYWRQNWCIIYDCTTHSLLPLSVCPLMGGRTGLVLREPFLRAACIWSQSGLGGRGSGPSFNAPPLSSKPKKKLLYYVLFCYSSCYYFLYWINKMSNVQICGKHWAYKNCASSSCDSYSPNHLLDIL